MKDSAKLTPDEVEQYLKQGMRDWVKESKADSTPQAMVRFAASKVADAATKKAYDKAMAQLADMTEECKRIGRKEVVEWIQKNGKEEWWGIAIYDRDGKWQSKLKGWNLQEIEDGS